VAVGDIRRRFGLDPEAMSPIARNGTSAFVGLPEREATKLQDLWERDEVGLELSVEVHAPVVVGVYPMRIARFVLEQTNGYQAHLNGTAPNGDGSGFHPSEPASDEAVEYEGAAPE
jgi:hypothetical protein